MYWAQFIPRIHAIHSLALVIINYFDIGGILTVPHKTNAPLIIYTDTMLSSSIACKCLKSVGWRDLQVIKAQRRMKHVQFSPRNPLER